MRANHVITSITTTLVIAWAMSACGGFFQEGGGDPPQDSCGSGGGRGGDHHHGGGGGRGQDDQDPLLTTDAGISATDASTSVPLTPDADVAPVEDAGTAVADAGEGPAPDAGRDCTATPCACTRDTDCPSELVCDHAARVCVPPPVLCSERTVEADCIAAAACQPVYAGQDCRDAEGGDCVAGDTNCTCASFSFAACVDR